LFVRRAPPRPGGIGFVCTGGPRRPKAAGRSGRPAKLALFVRDYRHRYPDIPGRPSLALFRTIAHHGERAPAQAGTRRMTTRPVCRTGCADSGLRFDTGRQLSSFRLQIINRKSSIINHTTPLSRGRVAGTVTEFCARTTPRNGATPCARRNKESFARGVFYLFDCCTNGTRRLEAAGRRLEGRKTEDGGQTRNRELTTGDSFSTAEDAEGRGGRRAKNLSRAKTQRAPRGPEPHQKPR
jgi:hypothetical protein